VSVVILEVFLDAPSYSINIEGAQSKPLDYIPGPISIVIPTFNSSRTLTQCLNSIGNQTLACDEVIVVDRHSNDGSAQLAHEWGARVIKTSANRSEARNIGAEQTSSSAILFVDSDMVLPPTLIEECKTGLEKHDALIIPEVSVGSGFWAKCKALERRTHWGNELLEAARCFRKVAFSTLGGYNPSLEAGEDWDLQNRTKVFGLSIGRVRAQIEHDEGHIALGGILGKKFAYGKAMGEYMQANPHLGIRQVNPIRRVLAPTLAVFPEDPVHGVGVLILRSLEFTAAGMGYLRGNLVRELQRV